MKPARFKTLLQATLALALCAMGLAACSLSIGVTNSPPVPNVGSGPPPERR